MKDPAFLFYYQDFAYGTRKMTFEEKGAYIELLCEQADSGHLSLDDIKRILKNSFPIWDAICSKFSTDENGKFYNAVLDTHIAKRKKYTDSRKDNLNTHKLKKESNHMESHMESHMVNVNVNKDVIKNKEEESLIPLPEHILQKFIKKNCPNISKLKKQLTFEEAAKLFADFTEQELQRVIEAMENYKPLATKSISVNLTIRNWIRRDKQNGTNQKSNPRGSVDFNKWEREIRIAKGEIPDLAASSIK